MKRIITLILFFFFSSSMILADAINDFDYKIDPKIKKELKESIEEIYGEKYSKDKTDEIYLKVISMAYNAIKTRPNELIEEDIKRKGDWYKDEIIYMFYVDRFGVVEDDKLNTF